MKESLQLTKLSLKHIGKLKVKLLAFLLLLSTLSLAGCWDAHGVEQLGVVTLTGMDKVAKEGMEQWQMSFVVLQPSLNSSGPGSGGGGQTESPEMVWRGSGITVLDALNDFSKRFSRYPFFGQEKALVIGEKAFTENLRDILEVRERFANSRPRTFVLITKGEAYDILAAQPEASQTLSNQIEETLTNTVETVGSSAKVTVTQLLGWLLSSDRDAVVPEIENCRQSEKRPAQTGGPQETVLIQNLAVLKAGKLAGWLNKEETTGYLLATHKVRSAQIAVPFEAQGNLLSYVINKSDYNITPHYEGDTLSYDLIIKVQGKIYDSRGIALTSDKIKELEPLISTAINALVKKTVAKSQALGADFLGFSQDLHRHNLSAWEEIQPNWRERYSGADINISVDCKVMDIGKGASEIGPEQYSLSLGNFSTAPAAGMLLPR